LESYFISKYEDDDQKMAIRINNGIATGIIIIGFIFYEWVENDMRRHNL
jgi:hypothetical protein